MVLMGVDQSLTGTAVVIVDNKFHYYLIETKRDKGTKAPSIDNTRRLLYIAKEIGKLIKKHQVEFVAMEGLAFGAKGRSVMTIGGLSHILRAKFIEHNLPFVIIPPTTLKKYWFGKGNANKENMYQATIDKGYNIPILKNYGTKKNPDMRFDDNVVDAFALCIFIQEMNKGNISSDFTNMIEHSKDVVFTT